MHPARTFIGGGGGGAKLTSNIRRYSNIKVRMKKTNVGTGGIAMYQILYSTNLSVVQVITSELNEY